MNKHDPSSSHEHEAYKNMDQTKAASGEHDVKPVYLTQGEINALQKAIMFLKFECEETDSLLYAGSPLLNSVLEKVRDAHDYAEYTKDFHSRPNEYVERFMRAKLERSYAEELAPRERTAEQLAEILGACMYPFPVK
ncbi:hypothetical protein [Paenibacillus illinoisensis]|uniref:Uncharacterized protein n=1 Tax=Paenibacillus illinoisensis TaxID=59845 RepID=A0A2W0CED4_9BACL|nr:hypothetical protein [Paenibacillus illinoisensis]PYY31200.1 Uncharacterized protein PIL02S_00291 [Paenibacillus illinoisensis]